MTAAKTVREVLEFFKYLLTIDKHREKLAAEARVGEQRAMRAEIDNAERVLRLVDRFPDEQVREEIRRRIAVSITNLVDGSYPLIERMTITDERPRRLKKLR